MLCQLIVSARERINIHEMLLSSTAFLDVNFLGLAKFTAFSAIIKFMEVEIVYLCFGGVKVRLATAPRWGANRRSQTLIQLL